MNIYLFTYYVNLIWIGTIYFQICVNFIILEKNGDDWEKGEYTKLKRESWNAPTLTIARPNIPKPDAPKGSRPSEVALEALSLFSWNSTKWEVT